jgi:DNA-binding NarL/FixJ family response regulator
VKSSGLHAGRLSDAQHRILQLLALGETCQVIARRLDRSTRTIGSEIAVAMRVLAASTRFHLGVITVRDRWVETRRILERAAPRRIAEQWHKPTMRQMTILRHLAEGATVSSVTATTGVSARTVQRDVGRLATLNGAPGASAGGAAAGALFEALGWT